MLAFVCSALFVGAVFQDVPTSIGFSHSPASETLVKRRTWLFDHTSDLPDNGYDYGSEGSGREAYFPLGEGDRLYYISWVYLGPNQSTKIRGACWIRRGNKVQRVWAVDFLPVKKFKPPVGTLALIASESGTDQMRYVVDPSSRDFQIARKDLDRRQMLADYHFGEHGDVSLQANVLLIDVKGQDFVRLYMDPHNGKYRLAVLREEANLLKR